MQSRVDRRRVDLAQRDIGDRQRPLAVTGVAEDRPEHVEQVETCESRRLLRVRHEWPEFEDELPEPRRTGEGVLGLSLPHGVGGGRDGATIVLRELPVVGQGRRVAAAVLVQHLGVGAVQTRALSGQQIVVHGFAQQGVPEPVVVFADDDDAAAHGLADGVVDPILRKLDETQQQRIRERPLGAGQDLHHAARIVSEAVEPGEQEVAQALRQGPLGAPGDLLHEEGDALRPDLQPLQRRRGRRASRDLRDELADGMVVETRYCHPFEQSRPRGLADESAHRVASAHVVGAAGDEQQQAAAVERPQEEGEDREGRVVGPVQVFDDDDLRRQLRGGLDEGGDRVAQAFGTGAVAGSGGVDELGQQHAERLDAHADRLTHALGSQPLHERAEDAREGPERRTRGAEVEAPADVHVCRARDLGAELPHQPGLADSGFALDEQRGGHALAYAVEQAAHPGDLGVTPDHRGGGGWGHGPIVPLPPDIRRAGERQHDAVRHRATTGSHAPAWDARGTGVPRRARRRRSRRSGPAGRGTI